MKTVMNKGAIYQFLPEFAVKIAVRHAPEKKAAVPVKKIAMTKKYRSEAAGHPLFSILRGDNRDIRPEPDWQPGKPDCRQ